VYAEQIYEAYEKLDEWFIHAEAESKIDGWDRSVLRRLARSSIIEGRECDHEGQMEWTIPQKTVDYIEEKGYV
jgi:hypothetical protein